MIVIRFALVLFIAVFLTLAVAAQQEVLDKEDLQLLEGEWRGAGSFIMPVTTLEIDIEGTALFEKNDDSGFVRTSMKGSKLIFSYADSGHLWIDPVSDTLTWEIWDGFGRHVMYQGVIEDGVINALCEDGRKTYRISVEFIGRDSLNFRLEHGKDGTFTTKAKFDLGRVR